MYRSIVAPVDGSVFGEQALPHAAAVARRTGAALHVVHVHMPLLAPSGVEAVAFRAAWDDFTKREERGYLARLVERVAASSGVRAETALLDGPVTPALARYALRAGAGLVVMSTHGHTRLRRLWHHCVCSEIAAALPVPVLMVRPPREDEEPELVPPPRLEHILVPLDGSVYAERMLEHALAFGRPFDARVTLLRVVRPAPAAGYSVLSGAGHWSERYLERDRAMARAYLDGVAARVRHGTREVRVATVIADDPAAAIVEFVAAPPARPLDRVDLIAMECHPHRPVARMLGAHTADRVIHDAGVPVLLFEPSLRPTPTAEAPAAEMEARH